MKKFTVKNYKGNLVESVKKFQETHKELRVCEAFEDSDTLNIMAEPNVSEPTLPIPEEPVAIDAVTTQPEQTKSSENPFSVFGSHLLMFGVEAHLWHLNCSRNSEHLALKDLYEACDDVGDRLLEAAIGQTNEPAKFSPIEITDVIYEPSICIAKIESVKNDASALIGLGDAGMDNILGEFCETCNSIIYKLKRLA